MEEEFSSEIESFIEFLVKRNILEASEDGQTVSKYQEFFQQFSEQMEAEEDQDSQIVFETKAIFSLADFLKALTPNEFYDISQKLYNEWLERQSKNPQEVLGKLMKNAEKTALNLTNQAFFRWKQHFHFASLCDENEFLRQTIDELLKENQLLKNEKNILELQTKKRNQVQDRTNLRSRSRKADALEKSNEEQFFSGKSSSRVRQRNSNQHDQTSSTIYSRLHHDSIQKHQQKVVYDVMKNREELKDCTFQPNSASYQQTPHSNMRKRDDPFIFERLSKSSKKYNPELLQANKEKEELNLCTFKPQTNKKSAMIAATQGDYSDKKKFFERLHKESECKDQYMRSLQMMKDRCETNQCTFQPEINSTPEKMSSSRANGSLGIKENEIFNRLHQDHEKIKQNREKVATEYGQKSKEDCTFQPHRVTKSKDKWFSGARMETSQQRSERLYEGWKEKEKKVEEMKHIQNIEEDRLHRVALENVNKARGKKNQSSRLHNDESISSFGTQSSARKNSIAQSQNSHRIDQLYLQAKDKQKKYEEMREKLFKEEGYVFMPSTNSAKYQLNDNRTLADRNKEFLEKKESHLKQLQQESQCDFQPRRVSVQSKNGKYSNDLIERKENLGEILYAKGQELQIKKEKLRQELSIDRNCTFQPQKYSRQY